MSAQFPPPPPPPPRRMGKKTKGKQKIEIKKIENKSECLVTFSKRKYGIHKMANELVTLTGAQVAFGVFSPGGKPFSFAHPSFEAVANRFLGRDQAVNDSHPLVEAYRMVKINELNKQHDHVMEQVEREKDKAKKLKEKLSGKTSGWWDIPVEELNMEQLLLTEKFYDNILAVLYKKIGEKKREAAILAATAAATEGPRTATSSNLPVDCSTSYVPLLPPAMEYHPQMVTNHAGFSCPSASMGYQVQTMPNRIDSSDTYIPPPAPLPPTVVPQISQNPNPFLMNQELALQNSNLLDGNPSHSNPPNIASNPNMLDVNPTQTNPEASATPAPSWYDYDFDRMQFPA